MRRARTRLAARRSSSRSSFATTSAAGAPSSRSRARRSTERREPYPLPVPIPERQVPMNQDIVRDFERVSADLVRQASEYQAAILADVNGRRGALHGRIAALRPRMKLAGPALTVDVRPGDNLMIHAAMSLAKPGDVLVIDGKGDQTAALMGTIMMTACKQLGLAGVVIDGAVRDSLEIDEMDFPVFSFGTNPNGPTKNVAGRIGHPVSIGSVTVRSGDLIVPDGDRVAPIQR